MRKLTPGLGQVQSEAKIKGQNQLVHPLVLAVCWVFWKVGIAEFCLCGEEEANQSSFPDGRDACEQGGGCRTLP